MKKTIDVKINGIKKQLEISPNDKLLDVLRREGYTGTKYGCGENVCGKCTIIMNDRAVFSCCMYAFQAHNAEIETIENIGSHESPHEIQKALVEEGAVQCGFCTPGIVVSAKAMFDENSSPEDNFIKEHMDGNLCRCTGYVPIFRALKKVSEANKK